MEARALSDLLSPVLGREVKSVEYRASGHWYRGEDGDLAELAAVGELITRQIDEGHQLPIRRSGYWSRVVLKSFSTLAECLVADVLSTRKEGEHV